MDTQALVRSFGRFAAVLVLAGASLAQAAPLSAHAAEQAVKGGALLWDVRENTAPGLPGALRVDPAALQQWLDQGDLQALEAAVSAAGIDPSRELVIYGDAGDARAQALVESLGQVLHTQAHWLVGGAEEWSLSGRQLQAQRASRLPVPQRLVAAATGNGDTGLASPSLRRTWSFAPDTQLVSRDFTVR